jgi:GTPase SAR1 family protein
MEYFPPNVKYSNSFSEIRLKLLILRDSGIGKTNMLLKYSDDFFPESHLATIGIEFKTKEIKFNDYLIDLNIWDTAIKKGSEQLLKVISDDQMVLYLYTI